MNLRDKIKFLTESRDSEDFGKDEADWKAAKAAKKAAAENDKK